MAKIPRPRFNLKKPQAKAETLIYLVYRYRGQKLRYSTQLTILPHEWDFKSQRPLEQERRPDLWAIRRQLDDYAAYTKAIYIEHDYGVLSKEEFKALLNKKSGRICQEQRRGEVPLLEFIDLEMAEMEASGMKSDTLRMFRLHTRLIKKFAEEKGGFS